MTDTELKKNFVAICGPFPEPLDDHPEEKKILGNAIALFKKHGTPIVLKRRNIEGGKKIELVLWRSKKGYLIGGDVKKDGDYRIRHGHKQTASMPVVRH